MVFGFGEVGEMHEALHPTHGSHVGLGLVNLVAISTFQ